MKHLPILIVMLPLIGSLLSSFFLFRAKAFARVVTLIALGATWILTGLAVFYVLTFGPLRYALGGWAAPWGIEYFVDSLSAIMSLLISTTALLSAFYAGSSLKGVFSCVYLLLLCGLLGIVTTADLFNLYVFLEIASLSAYALLATGGDRAVVSVFRYLLMGTIGASFYLLGLGYVYAATGTLNIHDLSLRISELKSSNVLSVSLVFFLIGLAIKTAVFPFHGWLPDVYTYAPARVTGFISAVMTKVAAYAIFRILFSLFQDFRPPDVLLTLGVLSSVGILFGSGMALAQRDVRRMLAYSSIAQLGYIVLGFSIGNTLAIVGSFLHVLNHAVMKSCLFLTVGGIQQIHEKYRVDDYMGLSKLMPWTSWIFILAGLSMIGIPPLCGFFSKWYLIQGAWEANYWIYASVMVVGSLLTAGYFFRLFENMYLKPLYQTEQKQELVFSMLSPITILGILILSLGILSPYLVKFFSPSLFIVSKNLNGFS